MNTISDDPVVTVSYPKATISIMSDAGVLYTVTVIPPNGDNGDRLREPVGTLELQ